MSTQAAVPQLEEVELPNGQIVEGVDPSLSNAAMLDQLARDGHITTEQVASWTDGTPSPADTPVSDDLMARLPDSIRYGAPKGARNETYPKGSLEQVGTSVMANMDVPMGIAGSIEGAKAGASTGNPWAVLAGTVGGGVAGTFGGEILSDFFMSEEPDFGEATKNSAIGAGIEVATLGAASKFKAGMKILGFKGDEIAQLWKTYTNRKPKKNPLAANPVGSPESLEQTQGLLEEGGGTLRAYQTGQANLAQTAAEGIAEVGVLSGPSYRHLDQTNATTIATKLQTIADESFVNPNGLDMGSMVHGIIDAGKDAAGAMYDKGLTEIVTMAGKKTVNPKWFVGQIDNFINSGKRAGGAFNDYSSEALKLASEWKETFSRMPTLNVEDMLAFQRKINGQIRTMGKYGSTPADQKASRDLAILSSKLRTTTEALLQNTNPAAHKRYKALNAAFADANNGLIPAINVNTITRANKGDYESIAKVLEGKNPNQIEAFLKSIDTSFNNAKMAGVDMSEATGVKTAKEAKEVIKSGWLKNIFGEISPEGFAITPEFQKLASHFEKPANARAAKMILGNDWPQFKMLLNAMSDATEKPTGFIGSLVLRSKEAQAVGNVGAAGLAGMAGGLAGLTTVLMTPVFLSKMVTRPKVIRKLLEGNKAASAATLAGKVATATEITEQTMQAVIGMFSEEDQAEIRNAVRNP